MHGQATHRVRPREANSADHRPTLRHGRVPSQGISAVSHQASTLDVGASIVLGESVKRGEMVRQVGCMGTALTDRAYGRMVVLSHATKLSLKVM